MCNPTPPLELKGLSPLRGEFSAEAAGTAPKGRYFMNSK